MPRDIAFDLAEYAANLQLSELPGSAILATKRDIFDTLATTIAGTSAPGVAELLELVSEWGAMGRPLCWCTGGEC